MSPLAWVVASGASMLAIAALGSILLARRGSTAEGFVLALVALAAGTLIGSAFFHLIPSSLEHIAPDAVWIAIIAGFTTFFALDPRRLDP
jgi:zinc and cadmium transporter